MENKINKRKTRFKISPKLTPYLLILPIIVFYALFWLVPVCRAIQEAFTTAEGQFTFENFAITFKSDLFSQAAVNTIVFAVISIILQYFLALAIAFLINTKFKGSKIALFVAMIPMAITPTAVAILWKTGLTETGWINGLLISLKIVSDPIVWLNAEGFKAVLLIVVIDTWTVMPSVMIILLAGLQGMQNELKEAGMVFGATKWQITKDIVIPILKPSIITSVILRVIAAVQVWAIAVMVIGHNKVPLLVERIAYYVDVIPNADNSLKIAYCLSLLVAIGIMIFTFVYYKVSKKNSVMEEPKE